MSEGKGREKGSVQAPMLHHTCKWHVSARAHTCVSAILHVRCAQKIVPTT